MKPGVPLLKSKGISDEEEDVPGSEYVLTSGPDDAVMSEEAFSHGR